MNKKGGIIWLLVALMIFMELRAGERLKLFASLLEFLAPKLNRTTVEADEPEPTPEEKPDYSHLSTEEKIQLLG